MKSLRGGGVIVFTQAPLAQALWPMLPGGFQLFARGAKGGIFLHLRTLPQELLEFSPARRGFGKKIFREQFQDTSPGGPLFTVINDFVAPKASQPILKFFRSDQFSGFEAKRKLSADDVALDYPKIEDGVRGMAFIEAVVKSSKANAKWTKLDVK